MNLKRMGVMNITPNSFSDGGEFFSPEAISERIQFLGQFEAIDIGAESTAPQSRAISWKTEWERWQMVLPYLQNLNSRISVDSYHPETVFELVKYWKDHKLKSRLLWNDVSGKFDESVKEYLKTGFDYVFCHNLAPSRELTGEHMKYVSPEIDLFEYFQMFRFPQVIFDPCLGFSKTYEQNWAILENMGVLQQKLQHDRWLIGFSRKSFLRKKYAVESAQDLDQAHMRELPAILAPLVGEVWLRTHRPELITN